MTQLRFGLGAVLLAACLTALTEQPTRAANWPRFRGPNGTGISDDKNIPVRWDETNILWKAEIPGLGNSSPIVWGNKVFLQSAAADGKARLLLCLNLEDGQVLWSRSVAGEKAKIHQRNSLASNTPATDGERVYALLWDGTNIAMHAYDLEGKQVWVTDLGGFKSQHGSGTSPMVFDGKVFLNNDQDGTAALLALDAATGKKVWEVTREAVRTCYSMPFVYHGNGGKPELIVTSTPGVTSYDPSTGRENWNYAWSFANMRLRTVASSVAVGDQIVATSGDGSGKRDAIIIKTGGNGDAPGAKLVWQSRERTIPYVPCMVSHGEHLFWTSDNDRAGIAGCQVAATGKEVWRSDRLGAVFNASPLLINDKIYAINEDGEMFVFEATTTFKLLAKNNIGETVFATPAVAQGRLLIRGREHLFCVGKPAGN